jgi:hypothetical protein
MLQGDAGKAGIRHSGEHWNSAEESAKAENSTNWTLAFAGVTDLIIESSPSARAGCLRLIDRSRQTQIFLSPAATGSMVMQFFLQPYLYQ